MDGRSFESLIVWQRSMDVAERIYRITQSFPSSEAFGLIAQLRRAAARVPACIAEGCGRTTFGEQIQFFAIARGSCYEIHTQLLLAQRLKFGEREAVRECIEMERHVTRLLNGLINAARDRKHAPRNN